LTSERKIRANRANARASTGPQTTRGRARAARNALRDALSLPVCSIPALSGEVETLAREIAGPDANAETQELARRVAEAQIDLRRVRYVRHKLLSDALANPRYDNWREKLAFIQSLLRKNAPDLPVEDLRVYLNSKPQGPYKRQQFSHKRLSGYCRWIAMNGGRCRDGNLPFEPSMRRVDRALAIAIIDGTIANFGKKKPNWLNVFKGSL
jgi:hypothetical protein